MDSTNSTATDDGDRPTERHQRALKEATSGLKMIRDEGPPAAPVYPTHGSVDACEAWAFDSASLERAQTAQDALDRVDAIMGGQAPLG